MKEKNKQLYGIAFGCPINHREYNCPINVVDHLSFKEKVKWINKLSKEKRDSIWKHHQVCTKAQR